MTISVHLPSLLWALLIASFILNLWSWLSIGSLQKQIANEFYLLDQRMGASK